jgi:hypothetical protein
MNAPLIPIDPAAEARRQEKLREAIAYLGPRYVLHPARPLPPVSAQSQTRVLK